MRSSPRRLPRHGYARAMQAPETTGANSLKIINYTVAAGSVMSPDDLTSRVRQLIERDGHCTHAG
jgi:hypothetical protein